MGRAIAELLAREGADVAIYARRRDELETTAAEIAAAANVRVVPIPTDVTRPEDCERAVAQTVEQLGGLDVLVTNMAGPPYRDGVPTDEQEYRDAFELVMLSVVRLCRLAAPAMQARGGGSIVVITTTAVHQLIPGVALSGIARLATTGFASYLAAELAADRVRVNTVLPGWIRTQRIVDLAEGEADARAVPVEQVYREQTEDIPMARFGTPDEIADAVAFLCSERSSYVTGVNLRVDGGWCLNPTF